MDDAVNFTYIAFPYLTRKMNYLYWKKIYIINQY